MLNPQISVGDIKFGDNIENYADRKYEYSYETEEISFSCYSFADTPVVAFVNDAGEIESVGCSEECIWQGIDLIGFAYAEFSTLHPKEPDGIDNYLITVGEEEQSQDVYDYDELGLQLWVFNKQIVTIMAST